MATASVLSFPVLTATPPLPKLPSPALRRTSVVQGRALEILGHAIEYMIDSRLAEGDPTPAENQAIRLLTACSRSVFEEAVEVVPMHHRVGSWVQRHLLRRPDLA